MYGRNRGPARPAKGLPHSGHAFHLPGAQQPSFGGGTNSSHHLAVLEEMRESEFRMGPPQRHPPHHPAMLEDHLAAQHEEIQALLVDNQGLAATHVALKQELEGAHVELQQMEQHATLLHPENDVQMREMFETARQLDMKLHAVDVMKGDLMQVQADVKELGVMKEALANQVQEMSKDMTRASSELQQVPALKAEIDSMKQELHRARRAIEYEQKGYAENCERGIVVEQNIAVMARELEKLHAEKANSEKRTREAAALQNAAPTGYNTSYENIGAGYAGNRYPAGYNTHPVQTGAENNSQYNVAGMGVWGAYGMQQSHGQKK